MRTPDRSMAGRRAGVTSRRSLAIAAVALGGTATALAAAAFLVQSQVPGAVASVCQIAQDDLGGFIDIPGGGFVLGADPEYPEEGPPQRVLVSPFRVQAHEVTNSQFAAFVAATGYVTEAEHNHGSAQFTDSATPGDFLSWWSIDSGATWRTPEGEGSSLDGRALHPVVHVTLNDARAYADWAGGRIPTEVEWEYAASLGLFDPMDAESGVYQPDGTLRANIWTGFFPIMNSARDGFAGTAPVGCFEPGLTGAYDMIGNVWEWTDTPFAPAVPRFTIKGGSYLCSEDFCQRYRVAARQSLEGDFSTAHIGFRIVQDREAVDG